MTIEIATTIAELNANNPAPDDLEGEGDDHIRLIKQVLKNSLNGVPGLSAPQTAQIVGGQITTTSSIVFVRSEVPNVGDVLNRITAAPLGSVVILRLGVLAEPITIESLSSGAGRISVDQSIPHVMSTFDHFMILFRDTSDRWRELLRKPAYTTLQEYNEKHPVGSCQVRFDLGLPINDVPTHLQGQVTWTLHNPGLDQLLFATAGAPYDAGSNMFTGVAGVHNHTVSTTTGPPNQAGQSVEGGSGSAPAAQSHTHSFTTVTTSNGDHQHTIDPPRHGIRLWLRTA
jgi:hypothetical protein